jgi:predicted ArsR family transcriptional regulator
MTRYRQIMRRQKRDREEEERNRIQRKKEQEEAAKNLKHVIKRVGIMVFLHSIFNGK